jgi:glycosyltransferase involved in cell wall biosynthesis
MGGIVPLDAVPPASEDTNPGFRGSFSGTSLAQLPGMRSRVPVALFLSSLAPIGRQRATIELVRRIDPQRFEVHVACFERQGDWLAGVAPHAASIAEFPVRDLHRAHAFAEARRFGRWCKERGLAIVHTTDLPTNVFGLPAAAVAGVPVRIGSRREVKSRGSAGQLALQRAAYGCAHVVVAGSRAAAERLACERVPAGRVQVVPDGIAVDEYAPRPANRPIRRVITISSMGPGTGHDILLKAIPAVLRRCPDLEFLLVGDGPGRAGIEALASVLGVADRVRFVPRSGDTRELLAASDLFVLPSGTEDDLEGMLQAMAAGLPVVAARRGGAAELVDHQRTGVLVPFGDVERLSFAVLDLVQWPGHAAKLGDAARRAVTAQYAYDLMVSALERIYLERLAASVAVPAPTSEMMAS